MTTDLRTAWPALSHRQRDALVAMGMGKAPRIEWGIRLKGEDAWKLWHKSRDEAEEFLRQHPELQAENEVAALEIHPLYSSSWEGFGLIWEECERRGWKPDVQPGWARIFTAQKELHGLGDGRTIEFTGKVFHVLGDGPPAPEALALAFCLACGVEVPEAWLAEKEKEAP